MSNQSDVIELGSSDDETEPKTVLKPLKPPKKLSVNQNTARVKNTLNAMVHIPAGVSILPSKKNSNTSLKPVNLKPGVKSFIPLKSGVLPVPVTIKPDSNKSSGCVIKPGIQKHSGNLNPFTSIKPGFNKPSGNVNPHRINQERNVNQKLTVSKKINPFNLMNKNSVRPGNSNNVQAIKVLPKLPEGITITKTKSQTSLKRTATPNPNVVIKKKKVARSHPIETVTLDDEDPLSMDKEPKLQWYRPPDEEKESNSNENPADSNYIEITIEDSPIKPKDKRNLNTPIAVDDSPFKQHEQSNSSDNEMNRVNYTEGSTKKLHYLTPETEQDDQNDEERSIEIELVPMLVDNEIQNDIEITQNSENKTGTNDNNKQKYISSTKKTKQTEKQKTTDSTKRKDDTKTTETTKTKEDTSTSIVSKSTNIGDREYFHPVYQQFIDLCLELENSKEMEIIIEKKIKAYYRQVSKNYTESEDFIDVVQTKMDLMRSAPKDMYLFIKDVVDQLNGQRKLEKHAQSSAANEKSEEFAMIEVPEQDSKRARQIQKLEKTLKKLHRAIQKLEEQEVDFDDDADSVYILTERYKERVVKVHAKLCQLTNSKMPSLPRIEIECRPGQPSGPAKRLNKWLNRRLPPGTPSPFPDFHDVLRCVRDANEKDKLGWNEVDIMEEARDLFTRCGKKLQRRRQENEWRIAASRLTSHEDPATVSSELKKKLEENRKVAAQKESELINRFADRQKQLKLEAEEITEKEAEESPAESEDDVAIISDEENEEVEDREKRKQRLVKLLKGKSKHKSDKETKDDNIDSNEVDKDKSDKIEEQDGIETEKTKSKEGEIKNTADAEVNKTETATVDEVAEDKKNSDKDSNEVNSDMDELHLLQKHHTENEVQSSDDSFIDISDSTETNSNSVSDNKNSPHSVYSIEDSISSNENQRENDNKNSGIENELLDQDKGQENESHEQANDIQETENGTNINATQENHLHEDYSYMSINSDSQSPDNQETNHESKTDDPNSKDYEIENQNDNAMDVDWSMEASKKESKNLLNSECDKDNNGSFQNSEEDQDMENKREKAMNGPENETIDHEKDSQDDKNEINDYGENKNDKVIDAYDNNSNDNVKEIDANDKNSNDNVKEIDANDKNSNDNVKEIDANDKNLNDNDIEINDENPNDNVNETNANDENAYDNAIKINANDEIANDNNTEITANNKIAIDDDNDKELNPNMNDFNDKNIQESNKANEEILEFEIPLIDNCDSVVDVHFESKL